MRLTSSLCILAMTESSVDIVFAFSFTGVRSMNNEVSVRWDNRNRDPEEFDLWIVDCGGTDKSPGLVSRRIDTFQPSTTFRLPFQANSYHSPVSCTIQAVREGFSPSPANILGSAPVVIQLAVSPTSSTTNDPLSSSLSSTSQSKSTIPATRISLSSGIQSGSTIPTTNISLSSGMTMTMETSNTTQVHTGLSNPGFAQPSPSPKFPSQPTSSITTTTISVSQSKKPPVGAILGGAISGSVVLAALILFIVIILRRRRRLSLPTLVPLPYDGNRVEPLDKRGKLFDISRETRALYRKQDRLRARDAPAQSARNHSEDVGVRTDQDIQALQMRITKLEEKQRLVENQQYSLQHPPVYSTR